MEIKFRDNGRGINKANIEKVKEPLYTSKSKGSGLGLSVSERIVKGARRAYDYRQRRGNIYRGDSFNPS